jgi:uncharacterized membrane protein YGL010W
MRARLDEYSAFHVTAGNEACHFLGIPLIIAGASVLLGRVVIIRSTPLSITLTEVVLLGLALFYVREARWLGILTALAIIALAEMSRGLPLMLGLAVFVLGWVAQFVGHAVFERRSPAFFRNLTHLLVGPAWILERLISRTGAESS